KGSGKRQLMQLRQMRRVHGLAEHLSMNQHSGTVKDPLTLLRRETSWSGRCSKRHGLRSSCGCERKGQGDRGTRGQGDGGSLIACFLACVLLVLLSPCLLVPWSPGPLVPRSRTVSGFPNGDNLERPRQPTLVRGNIVAHPHFRSRARPHTRKRGLTIG